MPQSVLCHQRRLTCGLAVLVMLLVPGCQFPQVTYFEPYGFSSTAREIQLRERGSLPPERIAPVQMGGSTGGESVFAAVRGAEQR